MNKTIDEIKSTQGVTGVYLFNTDDGVIESEVPSEFNEDHLNSIGKSSLELYELGKSNFTDINNTYLYYDEMIIVLRGISQELFLIIFFEPSANLNLLSMSINLVMEELKNFAENYQAAVPIESFESDDFEIEASLEKAPQISIKDLLNSPEMAVPLKGMESALAKLIGPMATIIFEDSLELWIKGGNPTRDNFQDLIDIINSELKDPEKIAQYKTNIEHVLN